MVKYDYPQYEIVSSTILDQVHVDDIEKQPDQVPSWYHVRYSDMYEIHGKLDDTGNNIIELKFERDKDGPGGTYTRTLHERKKVEKKKMEDKSV